MDWKRVQRRLERGFRATPRQYGPTSVVERRRPFPLAKVMTEALSVGELEEHSAGAYDEPANESVVGR